MLVPVHDFRILMARLLIYDEHINHSSLMYSIKKNEFDSSCLSQLTVPHGDASSLLIYALYSGFGIQLAPRGEVPSEAAFHEVGPGKVSPITTVLREKIKADGLPGQCG